MDTPSASNSCDLAARFVESALLASTSESRALRREVIAIGELARALPGDGAFHSFASSVLQKMNEHARGAARTEDGSFENSLYRAFDHLDWILGLDYASDETMSRDPKCVERVYENAGAGVQSSYATVLLALELAKSQEGAKWIDLGSGFGRVGLVIGLLRPDIQFVGYEFVSHRVTASEIAAARAGVSGSVSFKTQDLSEKAFAIPVADVYYMWDPFTRETYIHVLEQIRGYGRDRAVTILARGAAANWVNDVMKDEPHWAAERTHDGGNLAIFRSRVA